MKNAFKISLLALALLSANAQAATQRLDGAYFDVIYDDSKLGLFGDLELAGNTLLFSPYEFVAESTSKRWDIARSTFSFWIEADAGHHLAGATLIEGGYYSLLGKSAEAFAAGGTQVVDWRTPSVATSEGLAVSYDPATRGASGNWQAVSTQTFASGASKVRFTIENMLFASAGSKTGYSVIEKKYASLTVSAVPEPESYAMLLAGLGIIGAVVRRRKTAA